jgi:gliding motility-associated-like protein
MFKRFLPILTLLFVGVVAHAQIPVAISSSNGELRLEGRTALAPCLGVASAGTTTRTLGVTAKTNNKRFLCLGDSIFLTNRNSNLTEDPDPTSAPGIGYFFYDCPPTLSGQKWADVIKDPCLKTTTINNKLAPVASVGEANGRDTFFNNGQLQSFYNSGNPIKFYFAPATIYGFSSLDGGGDSACVNVNVADRVGTDTFSVVYLNAVRISNLVPGNRSGSFRVSGGLPQYDGSNYSSFIIQKVGNPAIRGTVTSGNATNGSTVTYTVPEDGQYEIIATDGVSCNATQRVQFPTVTLTLSNEVVSVSGDTACVRLTARNFTNVATMSLYITYNPSVARYVGTRNVNLPDFIPATNINFSNDTLNISWNERNLAGVTRADGTTIFELCFKTVGAIGTSTPVKFFDPDVFLKNTLEDPNGNTLGIDTVRGSIRIGSLPVNVKYTTDSVLCNGGLTGRINIIPTGIGAPFTYAWRSATNAATAGNGTINTLSDTGKIIALRAGVYYVTVTSASLDTRLDTLTVREPAALFFNPPAAVNPCLGSNTGSLSLTVFGGGVRPYTFLWSNGATTTSINNLASGTYSCTMTDSKGCQATVTGSIGANPITVTGRTITPALCKEVRNGSIAITGVSGGSPPNGNYTFVWSNGKSSGGTTDLNPNLGSGTYYVTIGDNSCTSVDSFVVPSQRNVAVTANITNVTCSGASTGTILATSTATGSTNPPYIFTWTGVTNPTNNVATSLAQNLKAGTYPLSVRDQDGCKVDTSFRITEPLPVRIDSVNLKNESCLVGKDGTITIAASGGTPGVGGYIYRWSRSAQDNQATISNLVSGPYTVSVTDGIGCTQTRAFNITVPQKPTLTLSTKDATCFEKADGVAKVIVTPPSGAVVTAYNWDNTGVIDSITNLKAGSYRVTVTLSNGCLKDTVAVIRAPAPLSVDTANSLVKNPTCPNDANGQINLIMKGGTTPYVYTWTGGQPTPNPIFASLKAGIYDFTVTDFNGCQPFLTSVPLIAPPDINVAFTDIVPTKCYGVCSQNRSDGRATAIASGGSSNTGIFSYQWSSGESTNRAIELCGGWQQVTVTDGTCFKVDSIDIPQPNPLNYLIPKITEPTCFGLRDGKAEVVVEGGTPPYNYAWSNGTTSKDIISIAAGTYSVIVTDKNLCSALPLTVEINQPEVLILDTIAAETKNVTCNGADDAVIKLERIGGNGGSTTYAWASNISQSDSAFNLKSGIYYITATDKKGCSDSISVIITQPDKIYYFLDPPAQPRCFGELTTVKLDTAFGSTYLHPFTISVDNGPQYPIGYQIPVFADEHLITVTEQVTGCSDTFNITISQPPPITIRFDNIVDSVPIPRMIVGLGTEVRLSPIIGGSLPIDSISWTPKDYLITSSEPLRPLVRPLDDRIYKLKVTDVNGCIGEGEISVELERNRNVFIPNVFSPNGDDKNDYFGVFSGVGVKQINYLRIYDRWGELVFQTQDLVPSNDPSQGWDGTFNNKPVQAGVYVYISEIVFEDGAKLLYRGDITVAR